MAIDPRRRQKKVERRAAKLRAKKLASKERAGKAQARTLQAVGSAPIFRCCAAEDEFSEGMQQVLFSRALPDNHVVFSLFLLDTYCLGVKDAIFETLPQDDFELNIYGTLKARFRLVKLEPACARNLVEGAVEYASGLGFPPHADYGQAKSIFGDVDASACQRVFEYGRDGKPVFVAGPYDNTARCKRIIRTLYERCGADGFSCILPGESHALSEIEPPSELFLNDEYR